MLRQEDFLMIRRKRDQGMFIRDIAAQVGCCRKTVTRALKRGSAPKRRRPSQRASKLDPYKPMIDRMLAEGTWNASVIYRELRGAGYDGGRTILWDYIRPKRALKPSRATVRYETAPGRQLQHDWGELDVTLAGERQRVFIAVNTLGYSRRFHVYGAPNCDAEHTYESLVRAFEHFGGVPQEVLVDNHKTAVVGRREGRVQFHPRFNDLAAAYGFQPRACRPYRARTKGKTERMVGYTKDHFFCGDPAFESFDHLNQCLQDWLDGEADPREHGTHGEVVIERFARNEAPALAPLPRLRFDTAYHLERVVAWDGYIDVAGNRYSVPDTDCGQCLSARLSLDGELTVYDRHGERVAHHVLTDAGAGWQCQPDHHARLWREAVGVEVRDLRVYEEVV
jgi:transposase